MKRVEVIIPQAYATAVPRSVAFHYGGGGNSVAVSVTVPESVVSSDLGVGGPFSSDVGGPAGGRSWSLVWALGVV
jgi:hypothetical protein